MKILITGASGFIGRALCSYLSSFDYSVFPMVRAASGMAGEIVVGNICAPSAMAVLNGCDVVVHLAARVHVMDSGGASQSALYRAINTDATLRLASQAARAGVKRFVFVSTIKVNGEGRNAAYRENDVPMPQDPYAISKWEAEQGLWQIAQETGMEVVVLRPPLVYGPGVKANFRRLIEAVARGWPLPLGALANRRSVLYLGNFVDAIRVCAEHPAAAGRTFLIDDGDPVSTPQLVRAVARALGRPARLLSVPVGVLELCGVFMGKGDAVRRLTGSLWVDSSYIRARLGWNPPHSTEAGLASTVAKWE